MLIQTVGFGRASSAPSTLLLDDFPNVAAHSVARKLRTAYIGAAIRVLETGGSTEADIGFDGNVLDEATLLSHCGANDGHIVKVYEQSGDGNAVDFTQTTASLQPRIVLSGAVVKKNGFPAAHSPAGADYLTFAAWNTRPSTAVVFQVLALNPPAAYVSCLNTDDAAVYSGICRDANTSQTLAGNSGTPKYYKNGVLVADDAIDDVNNNRDVLYDGFALDTLLLMRHEGVDLSNAAWANLRTNYSASASIDSITYFTEQLIYDNPSAGTVSGVESDITDHYGF